MSEEGLGIGARLRAAREERGWSISDVGGRLRLTARQIGAIEAEDFAGLGQPVFARGFVRNYARLLGLDPDELLEQMTRVKVSRVQETENLPFTPGREFWKSPWALGGMAVLVLVIAVPASLYWWLNGDEGAKPALAVAQPAPPAPELEGRPAAPAAESPAATAPADPQAAPAQAAAEPVPQQTPAPAAAAGLHLQFDEISWVQVRDSSGRIVHSGLNPAGSSLDVDGKAPFYLVVGNAAHVRVTYKGQPVDLEPFTSVNVARLTLNP